MNKDKIEFVVKMIPIIYPVMIFLGYFNYYIYYSFFDIEIFQYLNISELLFSFISMIIPIFIISFFILCYFVFFVIAPITTSKEGFSNSHEENDFDDSYLSEAQRRLMAINKNKKVNISLIFNKSHLNLIKSLILCLKKVEQKKYLRAFSHFIFFCFSFIGFIIKFLLWFFFIGFTISSIDLIFNPIENDLKNFDPFFTSTIRIVLFLIIWSSFVYAIIYKAAKSIKKEYVNIIQIIPIIFIILFSSTLFQKLKAEEVININNREIHLLYNGEIIKSNSEKIFIGKTSDYIFLRDLKNQTNFIYPIKDVTNIEIKVFKKKKDK